MVARTVTGKGENCHSDFRRGVPTNVQMVTSTSQPFCCRFPAARPPLIRTENTDLPGGSSEPDSRVSRYLRKISRIVSDFDGAQCLLTPPQPFVSVAETGNRPFLLPTLLPLCNLFVGVGGIKSCGDLEICSGDRFCHHMVKWTTFGGGGHPLGTRVCQFSEEGRRKYAAEEA